MTFLDKPTRFLLFTGKGGVGKTSIACAAAVKLADQGKKVLLVSTDPASNLDQVLGVALDATPTPIPGVPGLEALNIDPMAAAAAYRERSVGPYRGVLPDEAVKRMEEQLSGGCTVEVAAFDEFTGLIAGADATAKYDHIIFDTAPTGHTLRLLRLPSAWTEFIDTNERGASCLGPASALKSQRAMYSQAVAALGDAARSTIVLVTRPEPSAVAEADRTAGEVQEVGLTNQQLAINGVFIATDRNDPVALALEHRSSNAIASLPAALQRMEMIKIPLRGYNVVGIEAVRQLLADSTIQTEEPRSTDDPGTHFLSELNLLSLSDIVDDVAGAGHGLVMVMGKGGVGKTTVAAAIAVELASRGVGVHLTTTDPAAHLGATLPTEVPGLRVTRIDPKAETRAYSDHILASKGHNLDDNGRAMLAEDLRSPCTEEVAVFHAFSKVVSEARSGFVVIDTAPTGHTLLLLDAAGSFHREVMRNMEKTLGVRGAVTPMMRLRDPAYTKVLLVTLAETTPVQEAADLQEDLRRAGLQPLAWVVNNSLAATETTDPILASRARTEIEQIRRVMNGLAERVVLIPWSVDPPIGTEALRGLANGAHMSAVAKRNV